MSHIESRTPVSFLVNPQTSQISFKTTRICWNSLSVHGISLCIYPHYVLMTCLQCAEGPGPSTAAALSAEAPNDSHLLENYDFVANSTSEYCCIIAYCVLNFNSLDISINMFHSSVGIVWWTCYDSVSNTFTFEALHTGHPLYLADLLEDHESIHGTTLLEDHESIHGTTCHAPWIPDSLLRLWHHISHLLTTYLQWRLWQKLLF